MARCVAERGLNRNGGGTIYRQYPQESRLACRGRRTGSACCSPSMSGMDLSGRHLRFCGS